MEEEEEDVLRWPAQQQQHWDGLWAWAAVVSFVRPQLKLRLWAWARSPSEEARDLPRFFWQRSISPAAVQFSSTCATLPLSHFCSAWGLLPGGTQRCLPSSSPGQACKKTLIYISMLHYSYH